MVKIGLLPSEKVKAFGVEAVGKSVRFPHYFTLESPQIKDRLRIPKVAQQSKQYYLYESLRNNANQKTVDDRH